MNKVSVIGSGSWGTALAKVLANKGHRIQMWARNEEQRKDMIEKRENVKYLPNVKFPETLRISHDLKSCLQGADFVLMAVPTNAFRNTLVKIKNELDETNREWRKSTIFVNAAKGIEVESLKLLSEVAKEVDDEIQFSIITGPSHAEEVAKNIPTTVAVSSEDKLVAEKVQDLFFTDRFRVYVNEDLIGVQLGGALKNIIALGAGISDGLGFGDNGKAALMTRGLAEIARLGDAMGASKGTFLGLTGVGDLIVTCTSMHSRNRKCGILIGKGLRAEDAVREIGMAVEGVYTIKSAYMLSKKIGVTMPITEKLYEVLQGTKSAAEAVDDLMRRERNYEQI